MSILIVDDSSDIRLLLKCILEVAGFPEVLTADSGKEALSLLGVDEPGKKSPDVELILMDSMMPALDGIETCRRIKADERFREIPVIMVTAKTEAKTVQIAFAAGAIDYIVKPLDENDLLDRVRNALAGKKNSAAVESAHEKQH